MSSSELWEALKRRYCPPEWCLFAEVRNGTGAGRMRDRYADGIAVSMYPSRGIRVLGFELKADKRDLRDAAQALFDARGLAHD